MKENQSRFPLSTFWIVLGILLLTAGIQMGLLVGMDRAGWTPIVETHVMLLYWLGAAALLTWLIRLRMKAAYDKPVQAISEATKRVAHGDFTVRIPPIHEEEGKEDYLDFMIRDLNAMIAELSSIETLKTDFVSNVSHELKTPLAAINNYASLLSAPGLDEETRREYARAVADASSRLSVLITNILRLNRLDNHKLAPKREEFDLGGQLTECLLTFENVWSDKGIDIEPDIADDVKVTSDPELLSVVWNNLLSNAFKFTESGGVVGITLKEENGMDGSRAIVTVSDTGCGMSADTARHIFDRFYQGDTSHATEGNGLGLALVKRIADLLGAEVEVESEEGRGTTFTVRLRSAE